ncbi:MAG: DNA repair exonuclease [Firmicutes bacterium]|nr:DNA repair exonuclease [Bacillota bacterium]
MVKFIHAADIHLDSPLKGLQRYEGAPEHLQGATRQAFDNLIELALEEAVDFLLIAGDLYDGDWRDYSTGLYFVNRMHQLREANILVFIVRGNHDAASQITHQLTLPANVVDFSCQKAETIILEHLGVAIHGQGFLERAVTANLSKNYPHPVPSYFNIGLLHTALDGREGHEPYAPCSISDLVSKGYDYWALGHVHGREIVHEKDPWIVYPGNLQGRHVNETGSKGCTLVTLQDGRVESLTHHTLDVLRWCKLTIDCANSTTPDEVLDLVRSQLQQEISLAQGRILAVRLELVGASFAHKALQSEPERWLNEIRLVLQEVATDGAWLEKVKFGTTPKRNLDQLAKEHLPIGFLLSYFTHAEQDLDLIAEIKSEFQILKSKLPADLLCHYPELNLEDPAILGEFLRDAKSLIELALSEEGVANES